MAETRTNPWGQLSIGLGLMALAVAIASLPWSVARLGLNARPVAETKEKVTVENDLREFDAENLPIDYFGPKEMIQPGPAVAFPHDPPPHEGAIFLVPYVVLPGDMIAIEVLEALPGRPLSGERLVRPDGTVDLEFYGELNVAGLTRAQIKSKVILHLRKFIPDAELGLVELDHESGATQVIPPDQSDRVFVDVRAYNSMYYYILGDVNAPGRLPFTGNEYVLDAIIAAGGLAPTAAPGEIVLVRPARGDAPERTFAIDWDAILNGGDREANLQLLPGDRLIVGRDRVVRATVEMNRRTEPLQTIQSEVLFFASTLKALRKAGFTEDEHKKVMKEFVKVYEASAVRSDGDSPGEKEVREALRLIRDWPQAKAEELEGP